MTHYSQSMIWRNSIGEMEFTDDYEIDPNGCWEAFLHDDNVGTGSARIKVMKVEKVAQDTARIHILASKNAINHIVDVFGDNARFILNGHITTPKTYKQHLT